MCCANARFAAETARTLPDGDSDALAHFDEALAEKGRRLVASKFRAAARTLRERLHPADPVQRHEEAFERRHAGFTPGADGMGWLEAYLDAPTLAKAQARIEKQAAAARTAGDGRTLAQLRADALADLLTGRGTPGEVRVRAVVTVPITALAQNPDVLEAARSDPAVLDGFGPLDPATAGRLLAEATSFRRLFTDPINGADLTLDRSSYRPTAAQREWLRRRYGTCAAPGCTRPSQFSDLDHTTAWADLGPTDAGNLAPLHRGHHTLKHATAFEIDQQPDGRLRWVTPTAHISNSDPPPF